MKTKAVLTSFLGLTLVTSFLATSPAQAQIRTSVASKKTAPTSQLKTKVKAAAAVKEEKKKVFSLDVAGTYFGLQSNEGNYVETDVTASFALMENVKLNFDTGFESYMEKQQDNNGYDLESSLVISDIAVLPSLNFTTGLIGVVPTSRGSHSNGMMGGWGGKANFALKLGDVGIGLDNQFYQYTFKDSATPTPYEGDDLKDDKFYTNTNTVAWTTLSAGIPIGPVKWKHDTRYRVKTPTMGEEKVHVRYRTRVAYAINDVFSVQGGVYWQKQINDPKVTQAFFDNKFRVFMLQLAISI